MERSETALVQEAEETKALIDEVEGGNTDHAAWLLIQERVKHLRAAGTADEIPKKRVAALLGKSPIWVQDVIRWDGSTSSQTPFSRASRPSRKLGVENAGVKQVMRERPEDLGATIANADPETRRTVLDAVAKQAPDQDEVWDDLVGAAVKQKPAKTKTKRTRPTGSVFMDFWKAIRSAIKTLQHAFGEMQDAPDAGAFEAQMLYEIGEAEKVLGQMREFIDNSEDREDLADEIQRFLADHEAQAEERSS